MGLYLIFDDSDRQFDMEKAMGMRRREIVRGDEPAFERMRKAKTIPSTMIVYCRGARRRTLCESG